MNDTPICDANYFDSEPHGYMVVPLCVAQKMERELNKMKGKNMQTIPSNLNAEELLRWYDSTWNKLTNSEMEQRLADALKEVLDELDELKDDLTRKEEEAHSANNCEAATRDDCEKLERKIECAKDALGVV